MPETMLPAATPLMPRRRAVILGASSGIGAALARRLAKEGYQLALLARRGEMLKSLCDEINHTHEGIQAISYIHDVTDFDSIPGLFKQVLSELGGMDLFVYNAGIQIPVGPNEFDFDKDRQMMMVNALGALAWLDYAATIFQGMHAGQIVGISSVAGDRGRVGAPAYNTSKAALSTLLEALRNRLAHHGVHVLTVKPGFVDTAILTANAGGKKLFWVIPPEKAADDIYAAIRSRKQVVYTPGRWALLMLVVRHIPSVIFRRLSF